MFDAWDLRADVDARRRFVAAAAAAAVTLGAVTVGAALLASRPAADAAGHKKVEVSFRPPPPPPAPAKIEPAPPPAPPKRLAVVKPPSPVAERVVPAPAPALAPLVAPQELPSRPAPESDTAVAARQMAVGGTGDGTGTGTGGPANDADESPAPVAVITSGPVNLPEDADPPEPNDDNVQPEYPEAARATGVEAKVVLKIVIERDGSVSRVQVLRGDEPFVSAAVAAVRQWRYTAARLEDQPIAVFKIVNLTFQLRE